MVTPRRMKVQLGQQVVASQTAASGYLGSVLHRTEEALAAQNRAGRFLDELPISHQYESRIERLLVGVMPDLRPQMIAHYENGGPSLRELWPTAQLDQVDRALAALVPALGALYEEALRREQAQGVPLYESAEQLLREVAAAVGAQANRDLPRRR